MGGMTVNTYLQLNPEIAAKLSGVIYSAPFFGLLPKLDFFQKAMVNLMSKVMDNAILIGPLALHRITRNKNYIRTFCTTQKATPLMTASLVASFSRNCDLIARTASKVNYPYQLILGEKDLIVDNAASRDWHSKTTSARKELKLMAGAFHELSKEPNNGVFIETIIKFMHAQTGAAPKNFGVLDPKTVKFSKLISVPVAGAGAPNKRRRLLVILYFVIGLLLAIFRKSKRLFLIWPALPFLKQ